MARNSSIPMRSAVRRQCGVGNMGRWHRGEGWRGHRWCCRRWPRFFCASRAENAPDRGFRFVKSPSPLPGGGGPPEGPDEWVRPSSFRRRPPSALRLRCHLPPRGEKDFRETSERLCLSQQGERATMIRSSRSASRWRAKQWPMSSPADAVAGYNELTDNRAKPAVYFGGKVSRIIDFALSNAINFGHPPDRRRHAIQGAFADPPHAACLELHAPRTQRELRYPAGVSASVIDEIALV